ncbi:MAG: phage Tail Collar domain protein [Nevskia sp.]|nr:phage Tail Collar domain protein [Nevskia sp.]
MFRKSVQGLARAFTLLALGFFLPGIHTASAQGQDPFVAQLMYVPYTFAPLGWAQCDGQSVQITSNTALFSLLGTNFGGNGQTNFNLPDMRGRFPVSYGQGPGLSDYAVGDTGGNTTVTLLTQNLPSHSHGLSTVKTGQVSANSAAASSAVPAAHVLANTGRNFAYNAASPDVTLGGTVTLSGNTGASGSGTPVSIMPPYLTLNCIIALQGVFPPRQ